MDDVLKLAKECGASEGLGNDIPDQPWENMYTFAESELRSFSSRIRQEAMEEAAKIADDFEYGDGSYDYNAAGESTRDGIASAIRSSGAKEKVNG